MTDPRLAELTLRAAAAAERSREAAADTLAIAAALRRQHLADEAARVRRQRDGAARRAAGRSPER